MRNVILPDGTRCSVLGFGCGAVMGRVGRKDSLRAMQLAFEAGVTLYDTARSYGYGESEAVLGEFAAGRREKLLISTKFGTEPAQRQRWKAMLRPVARAVLERLPQARQAKARTAVRRGAGGQIAASPLSPESLTRSLERSLSLLGTDYVDFLFLHDAGPEAIERDDVFAALVRLCEEGKVRRFGVSSSLETAEAANAARPEAKAVQMPANLGNLSRAVAVAQQARAAGLTVLANNIFGGVDGATGCRARLQALAADPSVPAEVREKLRAAGRDLLGGVMLPLVLRHVGADTAIVSMMRPENIAANVRAVKRDGWSDAELSVLYEKLAQ